MKRLSGITVGLLIAMGLVAQDRRIVPVPANRPAARLALVIGNQKYGGAPLVNPVNDARAMQAALQSLGFQVELVLDADKRTFDRVTDQFVKRVQPGDVTFFYYSGHGMQIDGENYLIPADFAGQSEEDVKYDALSASKVQEKIEHSGATLNVIVLDACRDNPYRGKRGGEHGLAGVQAAVGTLVVFAADSGQTASDNSSESNGLFTKHLLKELSEPGLEVRDLFKRVQEQVYQASSGRQFPMMISKVIGDFRLRPGGAIAPAPVPETNAGAAPSNDAVAAGREQAFWDYVKTSNEPELFEDYLRQFPQGIYRKAAELKIASLRRPEGPSDPATGGPRPERLYPVEVKGQWGYINAAGDLVVTPRYEDAAEFAEGLAAVRNGVKWGFINTSAEVVIPFTETGYSPSGASYYFSDGVASFFASGIFIDHSGKPLPDGLSFYNCWEFVGGYGISNTESIVNKSGQKVLAAKDITMADGSHPWKSARFLELSDGVVTVELEYDETKSRWGMVDLQGKFTIPPTFEDLGKFCEKLAPAKLNGKWGFIDKTGEFVIATQFEGARCFSEGFAAVETGGKWGYIDRQGKVVIPYRYTGGGEFKGGVARVGTKLYAGGLGNMQPAKFGYIDRTGKWIWQPSE